jgi:dTDP-4-dehydrorhamnose 3,5-epimerase-like enzyme
MMTYSRFEEESAVREITTMGLIRGVELIHCRVHGDSRGELAAFEKSENIPFALERVFFIRISDMAVVRGGHANSCDELIVPMSGSVLVETDNGAEQSRLRLRRYDQALWIRAGIVIHLREFEPDTLLLVCASARYADTRHFLRPQPHLMMANCLV